MQKTLKWKLAKVLLANKVFFLGKRDDIPDVLAACDIYVQPSRSEELSFALVEKHLRQNYLVSHQKQAAIHMLFIMREMDCWSM